MYLFIGILSLDSQYLVKKLVIRLNMRIQVRGVSEKSSLDVRFVQMTEYDSSLPIKYINLMYSK